MNTNENVSIFYIDNNIEDIPDNFQDIDEILNDLKNMQYESQDIQTETDLEKYNVTELLKICEFYGFIKYVKMAKYKKNEIIQAIELFENSAENFMIVKKRQQLWYYMRELLNDKFMKKFVIWK
jgi:hypothetical protein